MMKTDSVKKGAPLKRKPAPKQRTQSKPNPGPKDSVRRSSAEDQKQQKQANDINNLRKLALKSKATKKKPLHPAESINKKLDKASWLSRDNVSYESAKSMSNQELKDMAKTEKGRATLRRMADSMKGGWSSREENAQISRLKTAEREADYKVPDGKHYEPPFSEKERTPEVKRKIDDSIQRSIKERRTTVMTNSEGRQVMLKVQKTPQGYQYTINGQKPVNLSFNGEATPEQKREALNKLVDYHSQTPDNFREGVQHIEVVTKKDTAQVEENGKMVPWTGLARISGDRMRINGLERVTEANFTHEMGHAVGYSQNSSGAPKGWDKATKSDKNAISGYGETGLRDDFADAWTAYREARETGPLAMEQFRAKYPNRAKLLDQVWANGTAA